MSITWGKEAGLTDDEYYAMVRKGEALKPRPLSSRSTSRFLRNYCQGKWRGHGTVKEAFAERCRQHVECWTERWTETNAKGVELNRIFCYKADYSYCTKSKELRIRIKQKRVPELCWLIPNVANKKLARRLLAQRLSAFSVEQKAQPVLQKDIAYDCEGKLDVYFAGIPAFDWISWAQGIRRDLRGLGFRYRHFEAVLKRVKSNWQAESKETEEFATPMHYFLSLMLAELPSESLSSFSMLYAEELANYGLTKEQL